MLLEFKTKNYKSFADELTFSMMPVPRQKGLDYSIQSTKIGSKVYNSLSSSIVYGPNASGKTNIIGAMDTMKAIVLRGNINNSEMFYSPNMASTNLELIPNCDIVGEPTEFSISFIEKDLFVEYYFSIDLGSFLNKDYDRKIIFEKLSVNEKLVFLRNDQLEVNLPSKIKEYTNSSIKRKTPKILELAKNSLDSKELFLTNGFKSIFATGLVSLITNWFKNKFQVIYRSDLIKSSRETNDSNKNIFYLEKTLTDAAKAFGIASNGLGYKSDDDDNELYSVFKDKNILIPAELFESYGTIRFINEFPLFVNALVNGGTLVVDEFDASIHPMAIMNLINIFHNDEININKAQFIFNTHNPIFLNSDLFRRDEINFVERDDESHSSTHYRLSDFKTADGVRNGEDYMKNYFVNRYGAIKNIDFSPIIESILKKGE